MVASCQALLRLLLLSGWLTDRYEIATSIQLLGLCLILHFVLCHDDMVVVLGRSEGDLVAVLTCLGCLAVLLGKLVAVLGSVVDLGLGGILLLVQANLLFSSRLQEKELKYD